MFFIFLKVNFVIFVYNLCAVDGSFSRIVNGYANDIASVPYIVQFRVGSKVTCGGSIISANHVLTAAHCLFYRSKMLSRDRITVLTGSSKLGEGDSYKISRITCHPSYNDQTIDNDACILRIEGSFELSENCKIIKLASRPTEGYHYKRALVSGYGRTTHDGKMSEVLRSVEVKILPRKYCASRYYNLTKRMFCAGYHEGKKDSCVGDSGGPLEINNELHGIVSFGKVCAAKGSPGVYASVYVLRRWIRENMK